MIVKNNKIDLTIKDEYKEFLKDSLFFDIETSGLSSKYSNIISITSLLYLENNFQIYQLFCEFKPDEKDILKYFNELLKGKKYIVTYNGNSFDIPFIIQKSLQHGVSINFEELVKIDLYNDIRHFKSKISTPDLKLKTVEEYFNISRKDTLTGKDITVLYEAYSIEPRKEFSELILNHNYEDVYNLYILFDKIINLYDKILIYYNLIIKINYNDFVIKKNTLISYFNIITKFNSDFVYPSSNYDLYLNAKIQTLKLKLPLSLYKDDTIKEFYYLNNNDYSLNNYIGIKGIKQNLIPIKFNDKIFYENIMSVISNILSSLFND